jgi:hypothetical protein
VPVFRRRDSLDGSVYAVSRVEKERLLRRTNVYKNEAGLKGKSNWIENAATQRSSRKNGRNL